MEKRDSGLTKTSKRRKKRSFMQRVQKLSKSKSFCKKTKFESVEYEYFMRVFKMTRIFEGSDEEKVVFANNALDQTEKKEVDCSSNQLISRVIESLLPLATSKTLERYFDAFSADLRPICNHEYASHVLQSLMISAAKKSLQESKDELEHKEVCKKWVMKVSKYLLNNIEEYISEKYANPVLRTAMYCLAGMPEMDKHAPTAKKELLEQNNLLKDVAAISQPSVAPPGEFVHLLEEFFTRISKWPQFKDFVSTPLQSGYLQCLLTTLHPVNFKQYKNLCKKILSESFPFDSDKNLSALFSATALPVLELMIEKSEAKQLELIYKHLLAGRVVTMCTVKVASFTLKKFLDKCDDAKVVAEMVSAVLPELPKILSHHYNNLIVSLCEACERSKSAQSEFFQGLVKALNCEDAVEKLVPAAMSLTPLPHSTPPPPWSKFGSMLVQSLLKFQKPIKVVNSLMLYSPEQLAKLLSSQYGSHVTTSFCKSEFVGEKSRQNLIQQLMGHYPELACSKFGSRSFDDIWDVADHKTRVQITKDLSSSAAKVHGSEFGKFVAVKVHLDDFRTLGADKWKEKLDSAQTKRKLFSPIIGGNKRKKVNKTIVST